MGVSNAQNASRKSGGDFLQFTFLHAWKHCSISASTGRYCQLGEPRFSQRDIDNYSYYHDVFDDNMYNCESLGGILDYATCEAEVEW